MNRNYLKRKGEWRKECEELKAGSELHQKAVTLPCDGRCAEILN
jgi:hypothetical protein